MRTGIVAALVLQQAELAREQQRVLTDHLVADLEPSRDDGLFAFLPRQFDFAPRERGRSGAHEDEMLAAARREFQAQRAADRLMLSTLAEEFTLLQKRYAVLQLASADLGVLQ